MRYDKHRTLWKDRRCQDGPLPNSKAEIDRPAPRPDEDWANRQKAAAEVEMQEPERWDGMS